MSGDNQGRLTDAGSPANGNYDLQFKLFDTVTVGTGVQQAATLVRNPVGASAGVFTVTLDFGANVFNGSARYFGIGQSTGGLYFFHTLSDPGTTASPAIYDMQISDAGNVHVTGTLSKGGGAFQIDHPLDPANKYLYHSFVESPDLMNIYNGKVTTDSDGDATIALPDYFEALNRDFRSQLTVIGQFAQAIVSSEVRNNRFSIKTDKPADQSLLASDRHPSGCIRQCPPHQGRRGQTGDGAGLLPSSSSLRRVGGEGRRVGARSYGYEATEGRAT